MCRGTRGAVESPGDSGAARCYARRLLLVGLAEGQAVELTIRPVEPPADRQSGDGFLRTEGALADDPHWDAIIAEIHQERKRDTRKELPE